MLQKGNWRKDAEGIYRVFLSGQEQPEGTLVEVLARFGDPKYVVLMGKHSSIKGGNLYAFRYTHKPEPASSIHNINVGTSQMTTNVAEVGADELDAALGLD